MNERMFYLGFSAFGGIGPMRVQKLLRHFGSVKNAWEGNAVDVEKIVGKVITGRFLAFRKTFSIEVYRRELERKNIQWITREDETYPLLLKKIPTASPPFLLYAKGDTSLLNFPHIVAIVGARKITSYGRQVTGMLTRDLVTAGCIVVSGLALGVDACAHETTIKNGGKTIAVLGCGVDCCFPGTNQHLYDTILSTGGLIISQFLPGSAPTKGSFPARNRIIAGLSLGTLVTEGAEDSGALITADYAFAYTRPVFAIPGPITSGLSRGPHALLRRGAVAVTNAEDILKALGMKRKGLRTVCVTARADGLTEEEQAIIVLIEQAPLHFDEIVRKIGKPVSEVGAVLGLMEIKGMVRNREGIYEACYR